MDPISFSIELELGTILIAMVGGVATWLHNRHEKVRRRQSERHHTELKAQQERHHQEHLAVMRHDERDFDRLAARR